MLFVKNLGFYFKESELKEQCSLEQQAKAHLEEELRNDLEEKDHKIEALQTKVS